MYRKLVNLVHRGLERQVPATGLGVFRIFFGLVILQEIIFLLYFRHLIFDPTPFIDQDYPLIPFFLLLWGAAAFCLTVGYRTRFAAVANYLLWVIFISFTPLSRDFDGGFDQLMIGSSFLLMFLPAERALSIDNLRFKLKFSTVNHRYEPSRQVSVLAYFIPIAVSLGLLYFDSAIHKLSAEHWRNGLGAWLPSSMPYYISPLDMSWLLNNKPLQMFIGYGLIAFQFIFIFLCYFRPFRVPLMLFGVAFHGGIILSLNIYPFGFAMLVHYFLMVPFSWWRAVRQALQLKAPALTVFYDEKCPLCNRTVIAVAHFDFLKAIAFKGLQTHGRQYRELDRISDAELLKDLYALDRKGRLYGGLDTYIQVLLKMRYPAALGFLLKWPGLYQLARGVYRNIADNRQRLTCGEDCAVSTAPYQEEPFAQLYRRYTGATTRQRALRIAKCLVAVLLLQLNSTIHYGLLYRSGVDLKVSELGAVLDAGSNSLLLFSHAFLGVTPHALYLHDHFKGYNHILALTYRDQSGREKWLPFVNEEGRMVAPNWGRVHSMWANIAVTPHMDRSRLYKFIKKVTAFWGTKLGLDLSDTQFTIKMKEVRVPMQWEKDLRNNNLSRPWRTIGKVIWKNKMMHIETPAIDIESL